MNASTVIGLVPRGAIRNRARAEQGKDYSGLRWGLITPTDFDGVLDFQSKTFVFFELKHKTEFKPDVEMPLSTGQRLAYERVCDRCCQDGSRSIVFVVEHDTPPEDQIPAAGCQVRLFYFNGHWRKPVRAIALRQAIDDFLRMEPESYPDVSLSALKQADLPFCLVGLST